jgi:hypothetical protein
VLAEPGRSSASPVPGSETLRPDELDDLRLATEEFEDSDAFRWLQQGAREFGFIMTYPRDHVFGFIYEPWHWALEPANGR